MVWHWTAQHFHWGCEKHFTASLERLVSDCQVQDCHDWLIGWYSSSTKLWMKMCAENSKEWFKKERLGEYWPLWLHLKALESMAPCSRLASTQQFWEETPAFLSVSDYSPFTLADPPTLTTHAIIEQHLPLWYWIDHFYSCESFTHIFSVYVDLSLEAGSIISDVTSMQCPAECLSSFINTVAHHRLGGKKEVWISSYFTAYYTLKPKITTKLIHGALWVGVLKKPISGRSWTLYS